MRLPPSSCLPLLCMTTLSAVHSFSVRQSSSLPLKSYHGVRNNIAGLSPAPMKSTTTQLTMVSNFIGGNNKSADPELPKDVKEAVSKCREAVQMALEKRLSRMDVEFPVGTKFGVEKKSNSKKKGGGSSSRLSSALTEGGRDAPTLETFDTSDRELARLFVEMFQPVGGESISVIFRDGDLAQQAGKVWKGDPSATCRITSINRTTKKNKKSLVSKKGMGMGGGGMGKGMKKKNKSLASKMSEEFDSDQSGPFQLPDGCEVALFVSPGPKELIAIEKICEEVGMGTLVVLLNTRLGLMNTNVEYFEKEFESVFYLSIAPQEEAPGCLMHHAYPNDWILARKPKVGPPKTIGAFEDRPSSQQCQDAYDNMDVGDFEKGVESALENVAGWFS